MKLSFSTKGWTGYRFPEFMDIAAQLGFQGIEVYDLDGLNLNEK